MSSLSRNNERMDDEAALVARSVAMAASAWVSQPNDHEAYRRFVEAVQQWNAFCAPELRDPGDDVIDGWVEQADPVPLAAGIADLGAVLRREARRRV